MEGPIPSVAIASREFGEKASAKRHFPNSGKLSLMQEESHRDLTQTTLRILTIAILAAASFWIARPFVPATIWATMIVIATWPAMIRLQALFGGKRGWAVAAMTLALLLVFVIPASLAALTVIQNSGSAMEWIQSVRTEPLPPPPSWLESVPMVGDKLAGSWREATKGGPESLLARMAPYVGQMFNWFVATMGGLGMLIVQFLLTVLICAIFYSNGESVAGAVRRFGRRLGGERY